MVNYMVNSVIRFVVYVSSVDYGGIPVGNDLTGSGSSATPYLTLDRALSVTSGGSTIVLNGNPASPTVYTPTSAITISNTFTFAAAFPQGAVLTGFGTTSVITLASGASLTLQNLIIDPSLNASGPGANGISVPSTVPVLPLTCTGCLFRNWTDRAIGQTLGGRLALTATNCTFTGDFVNGAIYLNGLSAGSVVITGCTITIARMPTTSIGGALVIIAIATGPSVTITNSILATTIDPAQVGAGLYFNTRIINIAGLQASNNAFSILGNPASVTGVPISLENNHLAVPSDDAVFTNNTYTNTTNGGYGCAIGSESVGLMITQNCQVIGGTVTGSDSAAAGDMHGVFFGNTAGCLAQGVTINNTGTPIVDKESTNTQILSCTMAGATTAGILAKGATNSIYDSNIVEQVGTAVGAQLLRLEANPPTGTNSTGITVSHNQFIVAGGVVSAFSVVDVNSTFTPSNNLYTVTSGTMTTNQFQILGINYTTCVAYKAAVEATATCHP